MRPVIELELDIDAAVRQQIQAAFNVLIQNCAEKRGENALQQFVQFVKLVEGVREVVLRALVEASK